MKIGDLVKIHDCPLSNWMNWVGLVIGFERGLVEVYWNKDFPYESEYPEQLEII